MAIDAVIQRVAPTEGGLRLELAGRRSAAPPAPSTFTIQAPYTWTPEAGQEVWGSARMLVIEGDEDHVYRRYGATLIEHAPQRSMTTNHTTEED